MASAAWQEWLRVSILITFVWACTVYGQFPQYDEKNVTIVKSPLNPAISVSFKSPPFGTCTTVFQTQKQYTGYVHLPPNVLTPSQGNYSINTFFWFIEARQVPESAPLTIFINGGPGSSSMVGLFQELGPCSIVEIDQDTLGTISREWGWDRSSNVLFIDQPVQVGFSYDTLTNMSLNLLDEIFSSDPTGVPLSQPSHTFLNGTFSSFDEMHTANTSILAAQSIWHFLQTFLATFPQYNPGVRPDGSGDGSVGVNLFTESYGGKFGPAMASYFTQQNELRVSNPVFGNKSLEIHLASLGIMNGWIDLLVQMPYFPRFAYSNSYNIQAISQVQELNALSAWSGANGCQQLTETCRAQQATLDPADDGSSQVVNDACSAAQTYCQQNVIAPYYTSGKSIYDISQYNLDPFPDSLYLEYLNQADVQQAIGVPVNFTQTSLTVFDAFLDTGDYARDGVLEDLAELLNNGVRVALLYGDRDYICNWLGGEAASFAIAAQVGAAYSPWYSAGYAPIVTNNSYIGGVVREYGNLSFSRIYDSGHLVPAYQPETAFTVFSRIIQGTGISLGLPVDLGNYASEGDANATHTNSAPSAAAPTCNIRAMNSTCDTDQKNMIANRAGVIINGVLYSNSASWQTPASSVTSLAGQPTHPPSSVMISAPPMSTNAASSSTSTGGTSKTTTIPTGVFTATGVPTSTSSSFAVSTNVPISNLLEISSNSLSAILAFGLMGHGMMMFT